MHRLRRVRGALPMGSISRKDPAEVTGVYLVPFCVWNCPTGAKYFDDEAFPFAQGDA